MRLATIPSTTQWYYALSPSTEACETFWTLPERSYSCKSHWKSIGNSSTSTCNSFALRERSYSCKSQWNSVDRTCTKNRWNPIYNAEPIRTWSDHDPTTHETVSHPSHRRGRSSRFRDGNCLEKHRVSCMICYITQKCISCETSFKTPSATHPPAPLAIPFTLRERSYSCKSHWNSVDRTCTKNRWKPIYNAEPIRTWSDHDLTTHETVSHPSHRRGRSSRFGDGNCLEKHRVSCMICYISQKCISCETFLQNSIGNSSPAPLAIPFTLRERSYSCKSHWNSVDRTCTKNRRNRSEHDPTMIWPHTRPSRTRRTAEVDHRGLETAIVWKNIGFRAWSAISLKNAFRARHSFKTPSATHPPAPLAIPFTVRNRSEHDPTMIRPHTRPSRTRRTAEVDHRGSETAIVWKNIGFRASAISQKRISCGTSSKKSNLKMSFTINSFPHKLFLWLTLSLINSFPN